MRDDWDTYYIKMAQLVATRSTCSSRHTGAILVDFSNRVVSQGYNGTPHDTKHCDEGGCPRCNTWSHYQTQEGLDNEKEACFDVHAEMNAFIMAAKTGRLPDSFKLYTVTFPCVYCLVSLVNAGCKEIYYIEDYTSSKNPLVLDFISKLDLKLIKLSESGEVEMRRNPSFYANTQGVRFVNVDVKFDSTMDKTVTLLSRDETNDSLLLCVDGGIKPSSVLHFINKRFPSIKYREWTTIELSTNEPICNADNRRRHLIATSNLPVRDDYSGVPEDV